MFKYNNTSLNTLVVLFSLEADKNILFGPKNANKNSKLLISLFDSQTLFSICKISNPMRPPLYDALSFNSNISKSTYDFPGQNIFYDKVAYLFSAFVRIFLNFCLFFKINNNDLAYPGVYFSWGKAPLKSRVLSSKSLKFRV